MLIKDLLVDALVRHKARLHRTPLHRYTVRVAHTAEEYEDAFRLVDLAFVYEGIKAVRRVDLRITPQHVLPEATVLVAFEGECLVGTMTVTLDSPAGLPLDKDYPAELAALRGEGRTLVEYGSLALVRRCWTSGVSTLLSMAAVWLTRNVLRASDIVIGINPRAVPFYRALYGFSLLGAVQHHADLDAPVQGMVCATDRVVATLRRGFSRPMSSGGRVHEHFATTLPDCVALDAVGDGTDWARWKMPREVFQELFVRRSDRLATLDPQTRAHLQAVRSPHTFEVGVQGPDGLIGRSSRELKRPQPKALRVVS